MPAPKCCPARLLDVRRRSIARQWGRELRITARSCPRQTVKSIIYNFPRCRETLSDRQ